LASLKSWRAAHRARRTADRRADDIAQRGRRIGGDDERLLAAARERGA
jgi:hypothetical protein